ncbi:hypothetical protein ACOZB2_03980 [Pantoea endophytica]|uniref:YajA protein n=1 Tax=Pantoea sp. BJ2 TaxID=3141322 RepID=A0AAU7U4Q2_9GAMM
MSNGTRIFTSDPVKVKEMRIKAGLDLNGAAQEFGYTLSAWQAKESTGKSYRGIRIGEWKYLLLLAGEHDQYEIKKR